MLNRDILVKRLMAEFESKGDKTPLEVLAERKRLREIGLYELGKYFASIFPKEDPYELKAA